MHFRRRRAKQPAIPAYALAAYATRPEKYGDHACRLPSPDDPGQRSLNVKHSEVRPSQVDCLHCGSLFTLHSETVTRRVQRKVPVIVTRQHPHPILARQGHTYTTTEMQARTVPVTSTTNRWVFDEPRAMKPGALLSDSGRQWWDGAAGKWVQLPGLRRSQPAVPGSKARPNQSLQ
jgi:hypothetical protein